MPNLVDLCFVSLEDTSLVSVNSVADRVASFHNHGFVHGGVVSAIADSAAGYAALGLMPADTGALTTEFKITSCTCGSERVLLQYCRIGTHNDLDHTRRNAPSRVAPNVVIKPRLAKLAFTRSCCSSGEI